MYTKRYIKYIYSFYYNILGILCQVKTDKLCIEFIFYSVFPFFYQFNNPLNSNYLKIHNSDIYHMNSNVRKYESNNGNFHDTSFFQSVLSVPHFLFQVLKVYYK